LSQTFDVRFAPTEGLAAVLAAPANTLRWKGAGRISIQPGAITIAVKRGLLTAFARDRSRRITAGQLREVYREGAALRLEFSSPGNAREVLPLWANDREAAAEIVRLLPTSRTVEVEQASSKREAKFRPDPRAFGGLLTAALVIAVGVIALQRSRLVTVPAAPAAAPTTREPVKVAPELAPVEIPAVRLPIRIEDPITPVPKGTPAYGIAQAQLALFEKESAALLDEYRGYRTQLETDVLSTQAFADKLGTLELGWWNVTFRILEEPQFEDPALIGLRATQLAAARNWRAFLDLYTEGQLRNDQVLISRSFVLLERAEQMQARARGYVP
jgi:hypothetical protein